MIEFDLRLLWIILIVLGVYKFTRKPAYTTYPIETFRGCFEKEWHDDHSNPHLVKFWFWSGPAQIERIYFVHPDITKIHPRFALFVGLNPPPERKGDGNYYQECELVPGSYPPNGGVTRQREKVYLPYGLNLEQRYPGRKMKMLTDCHEYVVVIWE